MDFMISWLIEEHNIGNSFPLVETAGKADCIIEQNQMCLDEERITFQQYSQ